MNNTNKDFLKEVDSTCGFGSSRYKFDSYESAKKFILDYCEARKANGYVGNNLFDHIKPKLIELLGDRYVSTIPLGIQLDASLFAACSIVSPQRQIFSHKKEGLRKAYVSIPLSREEKQLQNLTARFLVAKQNAYEYLGYVIRFNKLHAYDAEKESVYEMINELLKAIRYARQIEYTFNEECKIDWDLYGLDSIDSQILISEIAIAQINGEFQNRDDLVAIVLGAMK